MPQQYKVMRADRAADEVSVGDFVYDCNGHDYGIASEDSRTQGIEYVTVTKSPAGDYPFFTIPSMDLDAILDMPKLSHE